MTTGRKLVIGGVIVAGLTAYMAYRGARPVGNTT